MRTTIEFVLLLSLAPICFPAAQPPPNQSVEVRKDAGGAAPPMAEVVPCPVRADTWIGMHRWEARREPKAAALARHGREARLVVEGRISFALLDFDLSAVEGVTIQRATLRIHRAPDIVRLHTVGLSTLSGNGPWTEGSVNYFQRSDGQPWSYPGSDLSDVDYAQGGSLYAYERARSTGGGWWEIDVPPALVEALASGDQFGLVLSDEKGQTHTRHTFGSRESEYPPVLLVEGKRRDRVAPGSAHSFKKGTGILTSTPDEARHLGRTTLQPGSVILRFGGAGDDNGKGTTTRYELCYSRTPIDSSNFQSAKTVPRWALNPLAPKAAPFATANGLRDEVTAVVEGLEPGGAYYFATRATDEAGNTGPVASLGRYRAYAASYPSLPEPAPPVSAVERQSWTGALHVWAVPELLKINPRTGALLESGEFPDHRTRNTVWKAADGTVALKGARNEFVAFQLALESMAVVSEITLSLTKPLFAECKLPGIFRKTGAVQLYREWFVPDDQITSEPRPWYPDALVPVDGPIRLPSTDNPVPGQTVQPIFVDIYIPHDATPGRHAGELLVRAGNQVHRIRLEIEVLPLELPDKLSFTVDLNCYSGVNAGYNIRRGTPEYRKLEQAYHRVAHLNRANLDILGYSHMGGTVPDHAPPLEGTGARTRVKSWKTWDEHFGPILDGSAFADLPRAGIPVEAIYLPFFENWPGDLRRQYAPDNPYVAKTQAEYQQLLTEHALCGGPIQEAFSTEYQERFSAVLSQFAAHLRQHGWLTTRCWVFFNDKYYYKQPKQGGRGISWWLLDEPNHRDDLLALNFFARLARTALAGYPDVPIRFRADISRVAWIRDLLAGQLDVTCSSSRFFDKNRYLMNDRYRFGREYWNYASTNHPRDTNVAMRAWCWRVWLNGGDAVVPWNTVKGTGVWNRAESLTVFYPGSKFGRLEPYASIRLKAFRRGEQDVEYLNLLARKLGWDREAVRHAVAGALHLSGDIRMESEEDAGSLRFRGLKDTDIGRLRDRVIGALTGEPRARR